MIPMTTSQRPSTRSGVDARFRETEAACSERGGLLDADELLGELRQQTSQPLSWMARRIASREFISFTFRHAIWIPKFQFSSEGSYEPRPLVACVAREMAGLRADWDLLEWFLGSNDSLDGQRPVDLLDSNDAAVLQAARADASAMRRRRAGLNA